MAAVEAAAANGNNFKYRGIVEWDLGIKNGDHWLHVAWGGRIGFNTLYVIKIVPS